MPSFLLSGFMFPFRGMPVWAQYLGELFPTTHAMRIVRGVLLKGNSLDDIVPELWPLALFALVVIGIAVCATARRWIDGGLSLLPGCCRATRRSRYLSTTHRLRALPTSIWPLARFSWMMNGRCRAEPDHG
jgi:ABC-2 type transporter